MQEVRRGEYSLGPEEPSLEHRKPVLTLHRAVDYRQEVAEPR